jgi:Tetratricopeptide repeat
MINSHIGNSWFGIGVVLCALSTLSFQARPVTPDERKAANESYQAGDWAKAASAYDSIVRREPQNAGAWYRLGRSYHSMSKYDLATDAYEHSLSIRSVPEAMYNLACSLTMMNRKEKALEWLQKAVQAGFGDVDLLNSDTDLTKLRDESAFKTIATGVERNARPCLFRPQAKEFDFWVGEWEVQTPQGQIAGTNSVQRILGDCVLLENWTGSRGGTGKSLNFFSAARQKWQQTWVDDKGNVQEFVGEYKDGAMRFQGESPTPGGDGTLRRLTFFNLAPDRVRQLSEFSTDGGKTWSVGYDFTYIRKE